MLELYYPMIQFLIISVTQPVRYSFAFHISCKVKYFRKVADVKGKIRGEDDVLSCVSQLPYQLVAVDCCRSQHNG